MTGYTNVFTSVFDGSLAGRWPALPVWLTMLGMSDHLGRVDKTLDVISMLSGWPVDLLRAGISELMQPDPHSRSQREQGRRLVLLEPGRDWGWQIVNRDIYRNKARKSAYEERRDERTRRHPTTPDDLRQPTTTYDDIGVQPPDRDRVRVKDNSETRQAQHAQRRARKPKPEPVGFEEIRQQYPQRAGGQRWGDAVRAYRSRIAEGVTHADILAGVQRYKAHAEAMGILRTARVQQAATFLGENRGFLEPWPVEEPRIAVRKGQPLQPQRQFRDDDRSLDGLDGEL